MKDIELLFDYDFIRPTAVATRSGYDIFVDWDLVPSKHIMIRGNNFYAMYDWHTGLWTTEMARAVFLMDELVIDFYEKFQDKHQDSRCRLLLLRNAGSKRIDAWHNFCKKQMWNNFQPLNQTVIFQNTEVKPEDKASFKLPYAIGPGSIDNYKAMFEPLFGSELQKLEWATGAIISGRSKTLQKMIVLYGTGGSGKSTWLDLLKEGLFKGYDSTLKVKDVCSNNTSFSLEPLKNNPLISIDDDAKLDRIEDNTVLNSIVSHGAQPLNTKYASIYEVRFHTMVCIATNRPVQITDAKSGLLRRIIDVRPTGSTHEYKDYMRLLEGMKFEYGAIADHCLKVFEELGEDFYENYVPVRMLAATNDFYDFIDSEYSWFREKDSVTLLEAWKRYQQYIVDAAVKYPFSRRVVMNQLEDYFLEYKKEARFEGKHVRNLYCGFKYWEFGYEKRGEEDERTVEDDNDVDNDSGVDGDSWLRFNCTKSLLDILLAECLAQLAGRMEKPIKAWADVTTKLSDIDTSKIHYVKVPVNHIVIDFDLKDETGQKSFLLNWKAASQFPPTYAELSKGGAGIHLHYLYSGDVEQLARLYAKDIEIKVFTGGASLRRRVSKCNDIPVATISSGLPIREVKKTDWDGVKNEKMLRRMVIKNLGKVYHANTKPSVDYIYDLLQEAYEKGIPYDLSDLEPKVITFAAKSTHHKEYCLKKCTEMHFKSDDDIPNKESESIDDRLIFFDIEVFPNLFLVNYKFDGGQNVYRMFNPSSDEVEALFKYKLVGFNNRKYDNHILWAASMGYSVEQLYKLSQKIIIRHEGFFGQAYNLSYTDIYDFASAGHKQSLKKFEIDLGIHHQELGLPWDKPVPEELWPKVAEYCDNDVIATEAVFHHLSGDWKARQILAKLSGLTVNDTTNQHTTKIIFGNDPHPQSQFNYPDLSKEFPGYSFEYDPDKKRMVSMYRGVDVGEGGRVFARPGMYSNVPVLDIASMHPHTIKALNLFGDKYTKRYIDLMEARILIKHDDLDAAKKLLDGQLAPFLEDPDINLDDLANALKTALNSVYGLTAAKFENKFRDPRNVDNVVAKRGALFMVNLQEEVEKRGFAVAHIKTDSIKIPDATPDIIEFVSEYGKKYGYTFEHESTYERMCLVNNAVYIAKYADLDKCQRMYGYLPAKNEKAFKKGKIWDATGAQFAQPYVFKTLFSHEPLIFSDYTETKSATSALYLDMNEDLPDVSYEEKQLDKLRTSWRKRMKEDKIVDVSVTFDNDPNIASERNALRNIIAEGHNYVFVGRVGSFLPVKHGGGLLMRQNGDDYAYATGTSGHRWVEAETIEDVVDVSNIDISYHENLVDEALKAINKYGDAEWFLSDDVSPEPQAKPDFMSLDFMNIPEGLDSEYIPFN